jgi:hypothetical protein
MRARHAAATVSVAALFAFACSGGRALEAGAPPSADAGPVGPQVTIHTLVPDSDLGPAAPASATWAAFRSADGTWAPLAESAPGSATYAVPVAGPRWAAIFVCADDQSSLVTMREGAVGGAASTDIELDSFCARAGPSSVTLSGTLLHLPQGSNWLDFGYSLETRGAVLPSTGTTASYEEVNLVAGTWDLGFGIRPSPGEAFSRIAVVRGRTLATDTTIDVDLAGPLAAALGRQALSISGLDAAHESLVAPVYYAMNGGQRGLDLGPQNIPTASSVALAYATLPAALQQAGDRYRAEVTARANDDSGSRGVVVERASPDALVLTLPDPLPPPAVSLVAVQPYPRVHAALAARPAGDRYVLEAVTMVSNRSSQTWRVTITEPLAGDVTLEVPDVSQAAGFDPSWALAANQARVVTVTAWAGEAWASHTTTLTP